MCLVRRGITSGYGRPRGSWLALVRVLGRDTDAWADDVWLVDSTPVECARSRPTVKRSNLAGWAGYGYCASHSRFFWGLRLHLVATPQGLPVAFALAHPKADEREVTLALFDGDPDLFAGRGGGQTLLADKGYRSGEFEAGLAGHGIELVRPAFRGEPPRRGAVQLRRLRQLIESIFDTLKGQLSLEAHHAHSAQGVAARVAQRLLAFDRRGLAQPPHGPGRAPQPHPLRPLINPAHPLDFLV